MNWFHRHEFDPDKWVLIEHYNLYISRFVTEF